MTSVEKITAILNLVKNTKFPKDTRFFDLDKNPLAHIIYGPIAPIWYTEKSVQ